MPYLLISCQITLESSITNVGDQDSDRDLMTYLDAVLSNKLGNTSQFYQSPHPPRIVLNKLEQIGYRVVAMSGVGQTCVWTLYK